MVCRNLSVLQTLALINCAAYLPAVFSEHVFHHVKIQTWAW